VVGLLVALALVLRLWGIDYGLPNGFRPDEQMIVSPALGFGTGDLNPHVFNYPTLLPYTTALLYGAYYLLGRATGRFTSPWDLASAYVMDPSPFFLLPRLLVALMGAGTCLVIYLLVKRSSGRLAAGGAAFFLAVTFLHGRDSHFGTVDVPLAFWITVAALKAWDVHARGRLRDSLWAGVFVGLAAATKYTGALAILPLLVAHVMGKRRARWTVAAAGMAGLAFLAASPFVLLDFPAFWRDFSYESWHMRAGHAAAPAVGYIWHSIFTLPRGLGWPLLLAALGGLALGLKRRQPLAVLICAFVLPYFLLIGSWRTVFVRYAIPLTPFLAIAAAEFVVWVASRWSAIGPRRAIAGVAFVALALPSFFSLVRYDRLTTRADTRTLAEHWIAANAPAGSGVAADEFGVRLRPRREQAMAHFGGRGIPAERMWIFTPSRYPAPAYRLVRGADLKSLRRAGAQYVVVQRGGPAAYATPAPLMREVAADSGARLLARFDNGDRGAVFDPCDAFFAPYGGGGLERPGPTVEVYRLFPDPLGLRSPP
jgi:4-amino-4-deoxy-L-arabinose transferase-like glycosyltransferase